MERFKELSLEELITLGNENAPFDSQCLLILHQKRGKSWSTTPWRPMVDPYLVEHIFQFDRNAENGQLYTAPDLNTSCHLAASHDVASEIQFRVRYFFGPSDANSLDGDDTIQLFPPITRVMSNTNVCDMRSFDQWGIFVHNVDSQTSDGRNPLSYVREQLEDACRHGLMSAMKFTETRRSGSSKHGSSPVFHAGFSKSNCWEYPNSRCTQFGHVAATLVDSSKHLSEGCKKSLLRLIDHATLSCPKGHDTFFISTDDSFRVEYRAQLNEQFGSVIDRSTARANSGPFISCEGFTVIIPLILSAHRDYLNDFLKGTFNVSMLIPIPLQYTCPITNSFF